MEQAKRGMDEPATRCGMRHQHDVIAARHGFPERAGGRGACGGGDSGSCNAPECLRRSAEQKLCGGYPFDDAHSSATLGAAPQRPLLTRGSRCACSCVLCGDVQQLTGEGQQTGTASIGEEAEVADADEAAGEQMQEKAAQELVDGQRHQLFLVAMCGVAPAESNLAIAECDKPVVGNGNAMGVGTEIVKHARDHRRGLLPLRP